ncbi:hypothetical protein BCR43DRAFT_491909 [Syncephalastrum racemosum]|uniref:Uncharacterized protein n=1 Tax=Syncephalastrum racemosum TaxID=13706 RepID=A0A1X2HCN8_SYNRA|nr:hypothetical protein BCR43DRAFT_491909 [Syncephalastrum racemosum]
MRTLEDAIISEMQTSVAQMAKLNSLVTNANDETVVNLIDRMRRVEMKKALVHTLFKASIYSSSMREGERNPPTTTSGQ